MLNAFSAGAMNANRVILPAGGLKTDVPTHGKGRLYDSRTDRSASESTLVHTAPLINGSANNTIIVNQVPRDNLIADSTPMDEVLND